MQIRYPELAGGGQFCLICIIKCGPWSVSKGQGHISAESGHP